MLIWRENPAHIYRSKADSRLEIDSVDYFNFPIDTYMRHRYKL